MLKPLIITLSLLTTEINALYLIETELLAIYADLSVINLVGDNIDAIVAVDTNSANITVTFLISAVNNSYK